MKSGQRDEDEGDEDLEPVNELPQPLKGEAPAGEFDDFDEEDFDDEFDDDFEEELEDEYDLSEFADVTEEDLAEDEEADELVAEAVAAICCDAPASVSELCEIWPTSVLSCSRVAS